MKLEAGKTYCTRDGGTTGPLEKVSQKGWDGTLRDPKEKWFYNNQELGNFVYGLLDDPHPRDIVGVVESPDVVCANITSVDVSRASPAIPQTQ